MEEIVRTAKVVVLKQGYHATMLFLDGTIAKAPMILEEFPNEHEDKIKYLYHAGKHFSGKHQIGKLSKVFLVMEAWAVKPEKGKPFIRPSRHPKRIEILHIACLDTLTKEQTATYLEYVRDTKG